MLIAENLVYSGVSIFVCTFVYAPVAVSFFMLSSSPSPFMWINIMQCNFLFLSFPISNLPISVTFHCFIHSVSRSLSVFLCLTSISETTPHSPASLTSPIHQWFPSSAQPLSRGFHSGSAADTCACTHRGIDSFIFSGPRLRHD